jgi:hypothetical protein
VAASEGVGFEGFEKVGGDIVVAVGVVNVLLGALACVSR